MFSGEQIELQECRSNAVRVDEEVEVAETAMISCSARFKSGIQNSAIGSAAGVNESDCFVTAAQFIDRWPEEGMDTGLSPRT